MWKWRALQWHVKKFSWRKFFCECRPSVVPPTTLHQSWLTVRKIDCDLKASPVWLYLTFLRVNFLEWVGVSWPNNFSFPFNRCVTVCSVTGSSVVDFNGKVHFIHDRCVYSLLKPQRNSAFEILAGFRERRRLDVPLLDYLKLSLQNPNVIIDLEQGGRVRVRRKVSIKVSWWWFSLSHYRECSRLVKGAQGLRWSLTMSRCSCSVSM